MVLNFRAALKALAADDYMDDADRETLELVP